MGKRIGLMGGTFNPIHLGHLVVAEEARMAFQLDEILFIPNQIPPHRRDKLGLADALDRYLMVCMAIAGNPRFRPSRAEIERDDVSYTLHTVQRLEKDFGDASFSFITGADSLSQDPWFGLDELLGLLDRFVVATRPGFPLSQLEEKVKSFNLKNASRVVGFTIPNVEISSTEIRRRIKAEQTIKYLVPPAVEDYILKTGLYR